jgi:amino acid adenylation domain-containing protein
MRPLTSAEAEASTAESRPAQSVLPIRSQPVTPRTGPGPWRLSFAQERIWFLNEFAQGSPVYNVPIAIHLTGRLDVAALQKALNALVKRHEALRTRVTHDDGEPAQTIAPMSLVDIPIIDLSGLSPEEAARETERAIAHCVRRRFDISKDLLVGPTLIRCGDQDHTLVLNLHHICADGPSMGILHQELLEFYQAFVQGEQPELAPLPVQYADFAEWQRRVYTKQALGKQLAFWTKALDGAPASLDLPTDFARPPIQTFRGSRFFFNFPAQFAESVKRFSSQHGVSQFMTLLAGFEVLLHRYTGEQDIVVGTPLANRPRPELEGLIGFFLNTLALRVDVSGDPSFAELLKRVRKTSLEAFSNGDLPFEQLLEALNPERDMSRSPVFQVMFTHQAAPTASFRLRDLQLVSRELETGTSKFDLFFVMQDRASGLGGYVEYNTDLFEPATVERMVAHLQQLVESAIAAPQKSISHLSMMSAAERHQVVEHWNHTQAVYPSDKTIPDLFDEQAAKAPMQIALIDAGRTVSYEELSRRANQLARKLKTLGLTTEAPVGLFLERSTEMMVAALAVLKAGGAYVALDPAYPESWLKFLLDDSQAGIVLTVENLLGELPQHGGTTLCLDRDRAEIELESADPLPNVAVSDGLAYLIYTSGSTGTPKGVMGLHRGAVNRFTWMWREYPFLERDVCCQKTSPNFVDSVWEMFGPLLGGVPSLILDDDTMKDPMELVTKMAEARVTRIVLVPSLMRLLLETYSQMPESLHRPNFWISSGEALTADLVERFQVLVPGGRLLNLYGSSEVAADVTFFECNAPAGPNTKIPLGLPIANTQVHLLDGQLQPVPVGVPGEIYAGGDNLARGYYRRPDLTAERFIASPLPEFPGTLYQTGDVGRRRADGEIEYVGRSDQQVKIRGFRVELAMIESVLSGCAGVKAAIAVAQKDKSGEMSITGYAVPAFGYRLQEDLLRRAMRERLPEHMVPARVVVLDKLPLLPNGKVNRRALPRPDLQAVSSSEPAQYARNEVERRLVAIWEDLLHRDEIGVNQSFFDLGGHSLLVSQLILRVNREFGKRVSLADVFHALTVERLAKLLEEQDRPADSAGGIVPIQPEGRALPIYCVRGGPLFLGLARKLGNDQPFLGLELSEAEVRKLPQPHRFEDMAAAFIRVLRQQQPHGPYQLCGLCVNGALAYEMACQLEREGEQVPLLIVLDTQNPANYWDYKTHRFQYIIQKGMFHLTKLVRPGQGGFEGYVRHRWAGLRRRVKALRWRMAGVQVNGHRMETPEDFDPIVHPASWRYQPQSFGGRMVLFQSTETPKGTYWNYELGWKGLAKGGLEVIWLTGSHLGMFEDPNVTGMADHVRHEVEQVQEQIAASSGAQ